MARLAVEHVGSAGGGGRDDAAMRRLCEAILTDERVMADRVVGHSNSLTTLDELMRVRIEGATTAGEPSLTIFIRANSVCRDEVAV
jgi:hypothetical protein